MNWCSRHMRMNKPHKRIMYKCLVDELCLERRRLFSQESCYFMLTPGRVYPLKCGDYGFGGFGWYSMVRKGGVNV